jgi:hypothetical protein
VGVGDGSGVFVGSEVAVDSTVGIMVGVGGAEGEQAASVRIIIEKIRIKVSDFIFPSGDVIRNDYRGIAQLPQPNLCVNLFSILGFGGIYYWIGNSLNTLIICDSGFGT